MNCHTALHKNLINSINKNKLVEMLVFAYEWQWCLYTLNLAKNHWRVGNKLAEYSIKGLSFKEQAKL